jgi:hypothetical protein
MELHWLYMGALGGVIGIGWLVVVPMYRGWTSLNKRMSDCVKESTTLLAVLEEDRRSLRPSKSRFSASLR